MARGGCGDTAITLLHCYLAQDVATALLLGAQRVPLRAQAVLRELVQRQLDAAEQRLGEDEAAVQAEAHRAGGGRHGHAPEGAPHLEEEEEAEEVEESGVGTRATGWWHGAAGWWQRYGREHRVAVGAMRAPSRCAASRGPRRAPRASRRWSAAPRAPRTPHPPTAWRAHRPPPARPVGAPARREGQSRVSLGSCGLSVVSGQRGVALRRAAARPDPEPKPVLHTCCTSANCRWTRCASRSRTSVTPSTLQTWSPSWRLAVFVEW